MRPSTCRHSEEEWNSRKESIRNMYLRDKMSIRDIVQLLELERFTVTKHQLEYKLKEWKFRRKVKKTGASETWQYIDYQRNKRLLQGKETVVTLSGSIIEMHKVDRESARYRRFTYGPATSPEPPEGLCLDLRTPSPPPSSWTATWPANMPWIQFQSFNVAISHALSITRNELNLGLVTGQEVGIEALLDCITSLNSVFDPFYTKPKPKSGSISSLCSDLQSLMPELYPGEAKLRVEIIKSGPTVRALQQLSEVLLFALANNCFKFGMLYPDYHRIRLVAATWTLILSILERSGLLSVPLKIDTAGLTTESTLLAAREKLFCQALNLTSWVERSRSIEKQEFSILEPKILRLIEWLLCSGQDTQTLIQTYWTRGAEDHTSTATPLQIASWVCHFELLRVLLRKGADPNFSHADGGVARNAWLEPPILCLLMGAPAIGQLEAAQSLLCRYGAQTHGLPRHPYGFCYANDLLVAAAGHTSDEIARVLVKDLFENKDDESVPYSVSDAAVAAALQGNRGVLEYLHDQGFDLGKENGYGVSPIQAAAFRGRENCCKYLLSVGVLAEPNASSPSFLSPAFLACLQHHLGVAEVLYEHGACFDRRLTEGAFLNRWMRRYKFSNEEDSDKTRVLPTPMEMIFQNNRVAPTETPRICCWEGCQDRKAAELLSYLLRRGIRLPPGTAGVAIAVSWADEELLLLLLKNNINPNQLMKNGKSPLRLTLQTRLRGGHKECREKYIRMIYALLEAGADISVEDAVLATKFGDEELVLRMLASISPPIPANDLINHYGCNESYILEIALILGQAHLARHLLERSRIYCPEALCAATLQAVTKREFLPFVTQIMAKRHSSPLSEAALQTETTAIGIAACFEDNLLLDILLGGIPAHGFARWPKEANEDPALWELIHAKDTTSIIDHLIKIREKKDISEAYWRSGSRSFYPCSVLRYAAPPTMNLILQRLLHHGFQFDWTAVSILSQEMDFKKGLDLIKDHGVSLSSEVDLDHVMGRVARTRDYSIVEEVRRVCGKAFSTWNRPLRQAIKSKQLGLVQKVLDAGPKICLLEATWCLRPMLDAIESSQISVVKLLLDSGFDANIMDSGGLLAPLLIAVDRGHIDMTSLFLNHGRYNTRDGQKQLAEAIGVAEWRGHTTVAAMLRLHRDLTLSDAEGSEDHDCYVLQKCTGNSLPEGTGTTVTVINNASPPTEKVQESTETFQENDVIPTKSTIKTIHAENEPCDHDTLLSFDDALAFHNVAEAEIAPDFFNKTTHYHTEPSSGIFGLESLFAVPYAD